MTVDQRASLRRRYGSAPEWLRHVDAPVILAAVDDAAALAAALAEVARLRTALVMARVTIQRSLDGLSLDWGGDSPRTGDAANESINDILEHRLGAIEIALAAVGCGKEQV